MERGLQEEPVEYMVSLPSLDRRHPLGEDIEHTSTFRSFNGCLVIFTNLFTVYTDKLILKLKTCGAGCWVGHHFYGSLIYADDVKLLSPSITGLQKLVDTCLEFGVEYSLTFNKMKTICLKYSHCGDLTVLVVCLNGQKLKREANVTHGGNISTSTLDDKDDIELKIWEYFCQVNKLLSDFQGLRHDVLSELFNKYWNSFYGSQAWTLDQSMSKGCTEHGIEE